MGTAAQTAGQQVFLPQTRVLGDDLAPPRQIYITHIPAILALTGILSWVMGDEPGMLLASGVATAVAFYTLWNWLFRKAPTRFSTLMAMTLLLGYGAGTLNTWATLPRGSLTLAVYMGLTDGILARGMGAVLISSACLFFFGEICEKPIFGRDFRLHIDVRTQMLIYVGTLAILAGYATHSLALEGATSSQGRVSIPGVFLNWMYAPLTAVAVAAFLTAQRGRARVLSGLSAFVLLMMFAVMGRRMTIYTSIEVLLVLGLAGYHLRGRIFQKIAFFLSLAAIMVVGALTFMLLRIAGQNTVTPHGQQATVEKRIQVAGKMIQQGGAYSMAATTTRQNFQTRTFVISFFANVLDASSRMTPALGRDVVGFAQLAIPHVLYPDKDPYFNEEGLTDQVFGFSYGDQPNSVLTAGATDFGFIGVILYPLLLIIIIRIVYDFIARRLKTIPTLFVVLSFILMMLETENTLGGYFDAMRDSFLFGILLAIFMSLPAIRLRAEPDKS